MNLIDNIFICHNIESGSNICIVWISQLLSLSWMRQHIDWSHVLFYQRPRVRNRHALWSQITMRKSEANVFCKEVRNSNTPNTLVQKRIFKNFFNYKTSWRKICFFLLHVVNQDYLIVLCLPFSNSIFSVQFYKCFRSNNSAIIVFGLISIYYV